MNLATPNLLRPGESGDALAEWLRAEFAPRLVRVRDNRRPLDEKWKRLDRIWAGKLDQQSYQGRHKAYLKAGRQLVESYLHNLRAAFFPLSEWFMTDAVENVIDEQRRRAMHDLQRYSLDNSMRFRQQFEPFARQFLKLGTSPVKHAFIDEEAVVRRLEARRSATGERETKIVFDTIKKRYGPTFRVCDLYSWWIYPETVQEVEDAEIVFEDLAITDDHLKAWARRWLDPDDETLGHYYERTHDVTTSSLDPEFKQARRERLAQSGMPDPLEGRVTKNQLKLTEAYYTGVVPGAEYEDPESGDVMEGGVCTWLVTLMNDKWPVRLQQNPFWYNTVPYHAPRLWRDVDEFYGHSLLESADTLQYILNDIVNHTLDGFSISNNPIAIIDPNAHPRMNSLKVLPLAKWMVRPDAVRFDRPPDMTGSGIGMASFIQGMLHDYSGANAAFQGQPAARGRGRAQNSASGMGILMQQPQAVMATILDKLDMELGAPVLQRNAEYFEQFLTDPVTLRILGAEGVPLIERPIAAEDVVGRYAFRWLGAQGLREKTMLSAQMERLLPLLVNIQSLPQFQQSGTTIDFAYILRRLWSDGLGLHGADHAIKTSEQVASIDPRMEHLLLEADREIVVHPGDDDLAHLQIHDREGLAKFTGEPEKFARLQTHQREHMAQMQAKQQAAMMQAMQIQAMQQMGGGGPGGAGPTPQAARPQSMPTGNGLAPGADSDAMRAMQLGPMG